MTDKTFPELMVTPVTDNENNLPDSISNKEKEFRRHLDIKNKIDIVTMEIVWNVNGKDVPTKFRFDSRLIKLECIPDDLKENVQFQFCRAIWGALQFNTQKEIKDNMIKYVTSYFNDDVRDIHIFKSGMLNEPFTLIVSDLKTDNQIVWMKFLGEVITDETWKNYQESVAGKDSVVIKDD